MAAQDIPPDYIERVYAGVLGKLIGVYLGRPFEGWTYQRILKELGPVRYYVHDRVGAPLVVTDDDVSGTFVFVRALEEHSVTPNLSSEQIGQTWLNNTVEKKSIFWWGGRGVSTEHTAFLNLKHGIKAPKSGSIQTNGRTVAEQIGAQIFIDGWAMVAPGNPSLAAKLAEAAGSVSHDGESVHAAKLWAAMEAEAFVSKDVNHLLDVGLSYVPADSQIAKLISDVRAWVREDQDWEKTRQRIENTYGYDKFCGVCHVVPNHGLMICALLYAAHDFHSAMHIINTSGWDTDCNSGNLGCLVALINGLSAFDKGPDWRSPLADRALISSADGGYSLNNAARIALDIASLGYKLAGKQPPPAPKDGAQFHFTLPGSVQGFVVSHNPLLPNIAKIQQSVDERDRPGLAISLNGLTNAFEPVEVLTQTFTPPEIVKMKTYDLMAAPLVSPGQTVKAVVYGDKANTGVVSVALRLKHYTDADTVSPFDGPSVSISPGQEQAITWTIPDAFDSQPIQQVGLALTSPSGHVNGTIWLDSLSYSGTPRMVLKRPTAAQNDPFQPPQPGKPCDFWRRAWIDSVSTFHTKFPGSSFYLAQDHGEGVFITGTREWIDYRVTIPKFRINLGGAGVLVRARGLNRYYGLIFGSDRKNIVIIKAKDEARTPLASASYSWELDKSYNITVLVEGDKLTGFIDGEKVIEAQDSEYAGGGIGAVILDGSVTIDQFDIAPPE
ncbi:ADP-ribosylation/Crystallin J1 [Xylogone sp. PMI_703]|nr:ADP-ribosylation/Crystallin J1 [Xylogone sp. PMI_703]